MTGSAKFSREGRVIRKDRVVDKWLGQATVVERQEVREAIDAKRRKLIERMKRSKSTC